MISGTLMLFNWSLRMDSKSIYPHIIRAVFSFMMFFSISIAFMDAFGTSRTGLRFFETICYLNVLLITVSGVSYFVTAVTEEKDAGTFALLRLCRDDGVVDHIGEIHVATRELAHAAGNPVAIHVPRHHSGRCSLAADYCVLYRVGCMDDLRRQSRAVLQRAMCHIRSRGWHGWCDSGPDVCAARSHPGWSGRISATSCSDCRIGYAQQYPPALETIDIFGRLRWLLQTDNPVVFFGQQFWISMGIAIVLFTISTLTLDFWSAAVEAGGPSENPTIRRWSVGRSWPMAVMWKEFLFFTGGRSFFIAKIIGGGLVFAAFIMLQRTNGDESFLTLQGDYAWAAFLTFAGFFAIEVLLYSSGCLFYEIRQATQSTLAAIPLSGVRILLEKAGGCLIALIPSIFWLGMTVLAGYDGIARECSMTMVISVLIVLGFSSHMAVILSLYTRWAALPLTVLLSAPAFFCLAAPILGLTATTNAVARSQHIESTLLLSAFVNLFWTWLFILLPLQLWIKDRWNHISQF